MNHEISVAVIGVHKSPAPLMNRSIFRLGQESNRNSIIPTLDVAGVGGEEWDENGLGRP